MFCSLTQWKNEDEDRGVPVESERRRMNAPLPEFHRGVRTAKSALSVCANDEECIAGMCERRRVLCWRVRTAKSALLACTNGEECAAGVPPSGGMRDYRTRLCKDEIGCARRVCFFAHKPDELRAVNPSLASSPPASPSLPLAPPTMPLPSSSSSSSSSRPCRRRRRHLPPRAYTITPLMNPASRDSERPREAAGSTCASSAATATEREALACTGRPRARPTQTSPAPPLDPDARRLPRAPAPCVPRSPPSYAAELGSGAPSPRQSFAAAAAAADAAPSSAPTRLAAASFAAARPAPPPRDRDPAAADRHCGRSLAFFSLPTHSVSSPGPPTAAAVSPAPPPRPPPLPPWGRHRRGADAADNPAHRVAATADADRGVEDMVERRILGEVEDMVGGEEGGLSSRERWASSLRRRTRRGEHGFTAAAPKLHPRLRSAGPLHR
ncbi:atherin-like [Ananas comosus]|uniref:Atherin-like n=1 Tax=Ananas comosus TaxID=4615 RepID=A0A6P5GFF3_ANACO|nr:atherin-like [Ananas comosus]